jgi:hypothetical protein
MEEIRISCKYKKFRDIYGFWVKRKYRFLYYSGFRCEKPSEYYAAVCSIFNSCLVSPSIITSVEGCKGRGY